MNCCILLLIASLSVVAAGDSCSGRCDTGFSSSHDCQCNTQCVNYGDCCSDYQVECIGSCVGRCDSSLDTSKSCQCNSYCASYGDCCADYDTICFGGSCTGRCGSNLDTTKLCQCNSDCTKYGDCCADYDSKCSGGDGGGGGSSPTPVTSNDLTTLANKLWSVDENRASSGQFTLNTQAKLSSSSTKVDKSTSKLVSYVDASLLIKDTYQTFIALLDNYIALTGTNEKVDSSEIKEIDEFISAIMGTEVMTETYNFLYSKGYVSSSTDFENKIRTMWFEAYRRSSSTDSSGFEHVFVGELKSSSVTGFHNWIQLYQEEQSDNLNYYGYTISAKPDLLLFQFTWQGKIKTLSSVMFGASPEFEIALFSTCFLTKPNSLCSFVLDGNDIDIQTYNYNNDNTIIGSAYFAV